MIELEKINIRGINFANVTMDEAFETAKNYISGESGINKNYAVYTPNADITQMCIDDKTGGLFDIINSADMIIPDGAGVVFAAKMLKTPLKQKVAGVMLAYNLLAYLNETGGKLFLLGSTQDAVELAVKNINAQYENIKVFFNNGYFNKENEENNAVIKKINDFSPDAVFVCLGAPTQEKWIYYNKEKINAKIMLGLGGTINIIAGVKKYAPKIFIKLNLEWFYYLIRHPTRIKRFMMLPKFVFGTFFAQKKNKEK